MYAIKKFADTNPDHALIPEEPLAIRIQGKPYVVVMRTPGEETAHAAGFCLGEGIVDRFDEIEQLASCEGTDTNVVTVTLTSARHRNVSHLLERRGFLSQTSCGICGKEIVEDLFQIVKPFERLVTIDAQKAVMCVRSLSDYQHLGRKTRSSHAAAIYSSDFTLLSVAEDVGRHNAVDKAIGKLFMQGGLDRAAFMVLSSRISYELVQKAARARIPVVLAISRPTLLAVDLARRLNMTLACIPDDGKFFLYSGDQRIQFA